AVVLVAGLVPRELFALLLAVMAGLALVELRGLRRAGFPAWLELGLVALGVVALVYLRDLTAPPLGVWGASGPVLMTLLAVWAADVGAYLVGSAIGRRKIVPRVSPGKPWEGTMAGCFAAGLVVVLL